MALGGSSASENDGYYCRVTLIDLGDVAALNESGMFAGFALRRCLHSQCCLSERRFLLPQMWMFQRPDF